MFRPSPKSTVHIEVVDEAEYELEQQREREAQTEKREALIRRQRAEAAAQKAAPAPDDTPGLAPPSAVASAAASTAASPWTGLLASLALPPFFATLHDTRTYDPTAWRQTIQSEVPKFRRQALAALQALRAALRDGGGAGAVPIPSRSVATQIVLASARFLLPLPPPTPGMLSTTGSALPMGEDEGQADEEIFSIATKETPIDYPWQTAEVSEAAAGVLLALAERTEPASVAASSALAVDPSALGALTSPPLQSLLSSALPSLLPLLRASMRASGGGSATGGDASANAAWKGAAAFPDAYLVTFLVNVAPVSALSAHIADVVALLLPLVDDHELRFKVPGLASLSRLLQCVPGSAYPSGLGQVLLASVKTCLSFRERSVVALAVPTFALGYMVFFPPVLAEDERMVERIAVAEGLRDNETPIATPAHFRSSNGQVPSSPAGGGGGFPSSKLTSFAGGGGVDLRDRLSAQSQLVQTLVGECTFFTLSPSSANAFALFVHAQSLLPVLLYVGPLGLLAHVHQLLGLLLEWCTLASCHHARTVQYAWQCVELLLEMRILGRRVAVGHRGQLVEVAARAWITGVEKAATIRAPSSAAAARMWKEEAHPAAGTIVSVLVRIRAYDPAPFDAMWQEIASTVPELNSLDQAIQEAI